MTYLQALYAASAPWHIIKSAAMTHDLINHVAMHFGQWLGYKGHQHLSTPGLSVCAEEFRTHFSTYGKITEAQIMVDYNSGRSRGFGWVPTQACTAPGTVGSPVCSARVQDVHAQGS